MMKVCCSDGCSRKAVARGMCNTHYMREWRAGNLSPTDQTDEDYVMRRISVSASGCWEWQRSTQEGYGKMVKHGRTWQAHAFSYTTFKGSIPEGLQVNHSCHNRRCVNPDHLYAGTQKQNMADMRLAKRDRVLRGEENGMSKLNPEAVLEIRKSKEIARVVAERFSISISLVYAVRHGLIWRHVNA